MVDILYHRDIVQATPEWLARKAGKFSASKAAIIMGGLDTGGLASYLQDLAWEREFGPTEGGYKSDLMERGNLVEPESRNWYAFEKSIVVEECGFVQRSDFLNCGWSPDGLIANRGAIEAKNPLHRAWMEVKRTGKVPSQYRWQTKFAMWNGMLEYMDFVCYHPSSGGLIVPCEVTESERQQMAERVCMLEKKVQDWVNILREKV